MSQHNTDQLLVLAENFEKLAKEKGEFIFPKTHPKVKSGEHYPIDTIGRARNALSRANAMSAAPDWYKGTLKEFLNTVVRAVHKKYPSIEISEAAKKPGKG